MPGLPQCYVWVMDNLTDRQQSVQTLAACRGTMTLSWKRAHHEDFDCFTYTPVVTGNTEIEFGCKRIKKSGLIVNPRFSSFYVVKRAHQLYTFSENSGKCKVRAHKKKGATENYFIWYVLKHFRFANQPPKRFFIFSLPASQWHGFQNLRSWGIQVYWWGFKYASRACSVCVCVHSCRLWEFFYSTCVFVHSVCACVCAVIGNGEQVSAISPCSPLIPYSPRPFLW